MEEVLAIKPDIVFLWDEAWYAYSRFSPFHRRRSAMGACEALRERYASPAYRAEYEAFKKKHGKIDPKNPKLLDIHLLPDPDAVKLRVYATTSIAGRAPRRRSRRPSLPTPAPRPISRSSLRSTSPVARPSWRAMSWSCVPSSWP
jgi:ABC-type Fe3+-hydroxamate transport system substrate-binding protein